MSTLPRPCRLILVLLAALPLAKAAFAAGQAEAEPPAVAAPPPLPVVTINGAGAYDPRRDDTASKIVITRADILKYGDASISEVVKRLPGVSLAGPQGRGGEIRMRGLGSGYTQILLNGEAVPPGFSLDSIAPDLIEKIELMRTGSADVSAQAIAGALNIVLRKVVGTAQRELKVAAGAQNRKHDASLNGRIADKAGPLSYSLAGAVARGQFSYPAVRTESSSGAAGQPDFLRTTLETSAGAFKNFQLTPRATWTLDNGDTIAAALFLNIRHFIGDDDEGSAAAVDGRPVKRVETDHTRARNTSSRNTLTWMHKLDSGARLEAKLGADYQLRAEDVDWQERYLTETRTQQRLTASRYSDRAASTSGKYASRQGERHTMSVGWDAGFSRRSETHADRQSGSSPGSAFNQAEDFRASIDRLAWFAQDEWAATSAWSVYLGLRMENLRMRTQGSDFSEIGNRFSIWSPILQSLWKIPGHKNDQIRVALAQTYKAPEIHKLTPRRYISYLNSATNPDTMGNPQLRPERAWGLDATVEHFLAGGGQVSANLYARRIDDVTLTRVRSHNGVWVATPVNQGVAIAHGIELDAKLPLRALYKRAPAIELRANLSANRSRLDAVAGPDNRLDAQTPLSANLGFDYKSSDFPLAFGANFNFQSGGPARISLEESRRTAARRVLDLYGVWSFTPKTNLRISAGNVLQQANVAERSFSDSNGSLHQATVSPTAVSVRVLLESKL